MSDHPFGEPVEGEDVPVRENQYHGNGYQPRGKYVRSALSGKSLRVDHFQKEPAVTTALVVDVPTTPTVTTDQLDLIKRTVANGATADELKLYLFDCARQGVHPLDRLVHFTKRAGKYTPITSIDFMRIRAADTGEYAGSDDAVIDMGPLNETLRSASVTVWRLVQGQRCSFTATARWAEYKPEQNDFMWKKMPATMLAKCAEALALRKGFPRQLAGLYAKEEMDQADSGTRGRVAELVDAGATMEAPGSHPVPGSDVRAGSSPAPATDDGPDLGVDLPPGARLVVKVGPGVASSEGEITFSNGEHFLTWKKSVVTTAKQFMTNRTPCFPELKKSASGNSRIEGLLAVPADYDPPAGRPSVEFTEKVPF